MSQGLKIAIPVLLAAALVAGGQTKPVQGDVFWIGKPDGVSAEFGPEVPNRPVVFTVGKDSSKDWPRMQSSSQTFTINFMLEKVPANPLYLFVGFQNTSGGSHMSFSVNGHEETVKDVPFRQLDESLDPLSWPNPSQTGTHLAPKSLHEGENSITLKLNDGGWVIYDYVYLGMNSHAPQTGASDSTLLKKALAGPMAGVQDIVFAERPLNPTNDPHWYANFGYYADDANRKPYGKGGKLCRLNLASGKVTTLINDPDGNVRDPQVDYDGRKILFSYRKGGTEQYHLYEINADGKGLRQLTDGKFDDFEPTYLAGGDIVFLSSRCERWVNCWLTQVATMYRSDANGGHIRAISGNTEQDNTPWPLPDGRILYTRWEYVDRSQVHYHHLWTANPDGTGQMVFYGNLYGGVVMIDAKPVPGSDKVVSIFSPGHGRREHAGYVTLVDPRAGPDERSSAHRISRGSPDYKDPWAFSEECILAAKNTSIVIMNGHGVEQEIFSLPPEDVKAGMQLNEPRPLSPRPRERAVPARVDLAETTGKLVLADVYNGRNMGGVTRGEIKKLLVLESLPMPVHFTGGMEPISRGGTFTLERILGTVPVEPDGSAYFEAPALRPIFFVALDKNDLSVMRMQSFTVVQPGEVTSCGGCHEQRVKATPVTAGALLALKRPASRIERIVGVPDVIDFPRDVQPILDAHCVKCHDFGKPGTGVVLSGDRGPMYSFSYFMLTMYKQVADGRNQPKSNYPPHALGSSASPLMKKLEPSHHGVTVSPLEKKTIRLWIESGAAYPGTYAALGTGMIGEYIENEAVRQDLAWPSTQAGMAAIKSRCSGCHDSHHRLPLTVSDDTRANYVESVFHEDSPAVRKESFRHIGFDLSHPEKSLMLLAPLARAAGGMEMCGKAVFANTQDPDYQTILAAIADAKTHLNRFDMPDFRPGAPWIREMKRYGVLPASADASKPIDVYAIERKYWESLWYKPE
jgi:hypothetical protein